MTRSKGLRAGEEIGPDRRKAAGTGALHGMGVDIRRDHLRRPPDEFYCDIATPGPNLQHPVGQANLAERRPEKETRVLGWRVDLIQSHISTRSSDCYQRKLLKREVSGRCRRRSSGRSAIACSTAVASNVFLPLRSPFRMVFRR